MTSGPVVKEPPLDDGDELLELEMGNLEKTSEDLHRTLRPLKIDLLVKSNGRIIVCY